MSCTVKIFELLGKDKYAKIISLRVKLVNSNTLNLIYHA